VWILKDGTLLVSQQEPVKNIFEIYSTNPMQMQGSINVNDYAPTFKIIQMLQNAKEKLELEKALKKLDSFDIIIIDDIGYVQHSREEMEVFFTFLADRYERKCLMISSNLTFAKWDNIFKDPMTAMAAVDRLVHHSIILEFDNESIRTKQAATKNRKS
jgi:DNA replication protein DnaC